MKRRIIAVLSLALIAAGDDDLVILGGSDQADMLGCLTCNEMDSDSVWSKFGRYSWSNGFGVWNKFGPNLNRFSQTSACNPMASNPPIIVNRRGELAGYLTINASKQGSVCAMEAGAQICRALKVMCAD